MSETLANKLNAILGAKAAIKAAIESKGVTVPTDTQFSQYANLIAGIVAGVELPYEMAVGEVTFSTQVQDATIVFDKPMSSNPDIVVMTRVPQTANSHILYIGYSTTLGFLPNSSKLDAYQYAQRSNGAGSSQHGIEAPLSSAEYDQIYNATAGGFSVHSFTKNQGTYIYIAISLASNNA